MMSGRNLRKINQYLKDTTHHDFDTRYMATHDLTAELEKVDVLESTLQCRIRRAIITQLDDKNTDVQTVAVRCLSTLVRKFDAPQVADIIGKLGSLVADAKQSANRDVYGISLRTALAALKPKDGHKLASTLSKHLLLGLKQPITGDGTMHSICLDILKELLARLGSALVSEYDAIVQTLQRLLSAAQPALRKRASFALGELARHLKEDAFKKLIEHITKQIGVVAAGASRRSSASVAYIQTISLICQSSGVRVARYLSTILPALNQSFAGDDDSKRGGRSADPPAPDGKGDGEGELDGNEEEEARAELWSNCIQAYASILRECPKQASAHLPLMVVTMLRLLDYDPNYTYLDDDNLNDKNSAEEKEEEEDKEEEEEEGEDWGGDDEFGELLSEGAADEADSSWKIRRAVARALSTFVRSKPNSLLQPIPATTTTSGVKEGGKRQPMTLDEGDEQGGGGDNEWKKGTATTPALLENTYLSKVLTALVDRMKERDSGVKVEILQALSEIISQISVLSSAVTAVGGGEKLWNVDDSDEGRRATDDKESDSSLPSPPTTSSSPPPSSSASMSSPSFVAHSARRILTDSTSALIHNAHREFVAANNSTAVKSGVISMLHELFIALAGDLEANNAASEGGGEKEGKKRSRGGANSSSSSSSSSSGQRSKRQQESSNRMLSFGAITWMISRAIPDVIEGIRTQDEPAMTADSLSALRIVFRMHPASMLLTRGEEKSGGEEEESVKEETLSLDMLRLAAGAVADAVKRSSSKVKAEALRACGAIWNVIRYYTEKKKKKKKEETLAATADKRGGVLKQPSASDGNNAKNPTNDAMAIDSEHSDTKGRDEAEGGGREDGLLLEIRGLIIAAVYGEVVEETAELEVRETAISSMATIIARLGPPPKKQGGPSIKDILSVIISRLKNEVTRMVSLSALTMLVQSPRVDVLPVLTCNGIILDAATIRGFMLFSSAPLKHRTAAFLSALCARTRCHFSSGRGGAGLARSLLLSLLPDVAAQVSEGDLFMARLCIDLISQMLLLFLLPFPAGEDEATDKGSSSSPLSAQSFEAIIRSLSLFLRSPLIQGEGVVGSIARVCYLLVSTGAVSMQHTEQQQAKKKDKSATGMMRTAKGLCIQLMDVVDQKLGVRNHEAVARCISRVIVAAAKGAAGAAASSNNDEKEKKQGAPSSPPTRNALKWLVSVAQGGGGAGDAKLRVALLALGECARMLPLSTRKNPKKKKQNKKNKGGEEEEEDDDDEGAADEEGYEQQLYNVALERLLKEGTRARATSKEGVAAAAATYLGVTAARRRPKGKGLVQLLRLIEEKPERKYLLLSALEKGLRCWLTPFEGFDDEGRVLAGPGGDSREEDGEGNTARISKMLESHADVKEEGLRGLVADCYGALIAGAPKEIMPSIRSLASGGNATGGEGGGGGRSGCCRREMVLAAFRRALCHCAEWRGTGARRRRAERAILTLKRVANDPSGPLLSLITAADNDENNLEMVPVRLQGMVLLADVLPKHPAMFNDATMDSIILPAIYKAVTPDPKLVRIVNFGPFTHRVDDGIPLRRAGCKALGTMIMMTAAAAPDVSKTVSSTVALSTAATAAAKETSRKGAALRNCLARLLAGLAEYDGDEAILAWRIVQDISARPSTSSALLLIANELPSRVLNKIKTLLKASKGNDAAADRSRDVLRECVRALYSITQIPGVGRCEAFMDFFERVKQTTLLNAMLKAILSSNDAAGRDGNSSRRRRGDENGRRSSGK